MGRFLRPLLATLLLAFCSLSLVSSDIRQAVTASATSCKNCMVGPDLSLLGGFLGGSLLTTPSAVNSQVFGGTTAATHRFQTSSQYWLTGVAFCIPAIQAAGVVNEFHWRTQLLLGGTLFNDGSATYVYPGSAAGCYSQAMTVFPAPAGTMVGVSESVVTTSPTIPAWSGGIVGSIAVPIGSAHDAQTVAISSTRFATWAQTAAFQTLEDDAALPIIAGTLQKFCVTMLTAQSGTGSLVITVRVQKADTSIVMTVPAGGLANGRFCDFVNTASVTDGQLYSIKLVNNATALSGQIAYIGGELVPTTPGAAMIPWTTNNPSIALSVDPGFYVGMGGGAVQQATAVAAAFPVPRALTINTVRCWVRVAPVTNPTVFTLYKDGVATGISGSLTTGFSVPGLFTLTGAAVAYNGLQAITLLADLGAGTGPILPGCVGSGS